MSIIGMGLGGLTAIGGWIEISQLSEYTSAVLIQRLTHAFVQRMER